MTLKGGPAGPDGVGGAYENLVETDRSAWWYGMGGKQGVLTGLVPSGVGGSMQLSFTAGAALLAERDGANNLLNRGYHIWTDSAETVTFGAASASARNDAVVAAFVDTEDGAVGTGALAVGPHLVVVPGVSGTTTPRTDSDIAAYLGRGGWMRLLDVPIASTDTQIATGGMTSHIGSRIIREQYETGIESVSFTTQTSTTVAVTFDTPFTSTPAVFANINSGAGATARWVARPITISTTGFTLFLFCADAAGAAVTWASVAVGWMAVAPS